MSIEEICRRLLAKAIQDKIVTFNRKNYGSTRSVEELTAGDLCGVANLLQEILRARSALPPEQEKKGAGDGQQNEAQG